MSETRMHTARLPPLSSRASSLGRPGSYALRDEIVRARRDGADVLELSGASPYGPPQHVLEEASRAALENASSPSQGLPELREAIAAKLARDNGLIADPESEILITAGAMQALSLALLAVLESGDDVLVPSPCFFFDGIIRLAGGNPVYVPMSERHGFALDVDRLRARITDQTRAVLVSSPVNPTGYVFSSEDIDGLAELIAERGIWLISDESYEKLVYERDHVSPASLPSLHGRTITIHSFTKSYSLGSWRVGYVAAPANATALMRALLEWQILRCPYVPQRAAWAALSGPQAWVSEIQRLFRAHRDTLAQALRAQLGSDLLVPAGGPSFFLRCPNGMFGVEFSRILLRRFGVPSVPGEMFGEPSRVRVQFGATPETIRRLADCLVAALEVTGVT